MKNEQLFAIATQTANNLRERNPDSIIHMLVADWLENEWPFQQFECLGVEVEYFDYNRQPRPYPGLQDNPPAIILYIESIYGEFPIHYELYDIDDNVKVLRKKKNHWRFWDRRW